jgi:alanine racemase
MHDTYIEINQSKLIHNILSIRNFISQYNQNLKICVPVKANAYGHDIKLVTKILEPYADYFAVALISEAKLLRDIGIKTPILVFGAYSDIQIQELVNNNDIEITISSMHKARLIHDYCKLHNKLVKVHIKIDTGMLRIGVKPSSAKELIDYIFYQCPQIHLIGVYSHLANSENKDDDFTYEQIRKYTKIAKYVKSLDAGIICHLANSGGVLNYPSSYFDMVRPGILTYGYFPSTISDYPISIYPILSLKSRISYFKVVEKGSGVSYNHTYFTTQDTRIVTIPIGYGDGYRRCLSNIGSVIIRHKLYKISGNICMDMLMVDIGDNEAYVGDEVILIGSDGIYHITVEDLARICNTIVYEILCGFNMRIPRILVV